MRHALYALAIFILLAAFAAIGYVIVMRPKPSDTTIINVPAPVQIVPVPVAAADQPLSSRVVVSSPQAGASVSHSFAISGQAPGGWFFEAQFPVQVRDSADNVIGSATGHTDGDWMSDTVVPFSAMINVYGSYHGTATLVLMKDNPSGLPENDDSVTVPIVIN